MSGRTPRLLTAALAAAARGWPVFPVVPYGKRPAIRGWPNRASCDPDQLATWWRHAPYNIGIACGPAGLFVVDLDRALPTAGEVAGLDVQDGRDVLAALAQRAEQPDPHDTYTVATPRGQQRYFTVDSAARARARSTAGALGRLVDTRGAGGYVVAAGSVRRIEGRRRYYQRTSAPDVLPVPAPRWLLDALTPPTVPVADPAAPVRRPGAYARAALQAEFELVRRAAPGTRNTALFHAARRLGQLVGAELLDEQLVISRLTEAITAHLGVDGFTAGEAGTAIENGLRYGHRQPRLFPAAATQRRRDWRRSR